MKLTPGNRHCLSVWSRLLKSSLASTIVLVNEMIFMWPALSSKPSCLVKGKLPGELIRPMKPSNDASFEPRCEILLNK